jgi:hypothetical protein
MKSTKVKARQLLKARRKMATACQYWEERGLETAIMREITPRVRGIYKVPKHIKYCPTDFF